MVVESASTRPEQINSSLDLEAVNSNLVPIPGNCTIAYTR